ncbi:MAG: hypothetical protein R3C53_22310 [Pirellulaceae bacterium]
MTTNPCDNHLLNNATSELANETAIHRSAAQALVFDAPAMPADLSDWFYDPLGMR